MELVADVDAGNAEPCRRHPRGSTLITMDVWTIEGALPRHPAVQAALDAAPDPVSGKWIYPAGNGRRTRLTTPSAPPVRVSGDDGLAEEQTAME